MQNTKENTKKIDGLRKLLTDVSRFADDVREDSPTLTIEQLIEIVAFNYGLTGSDAASLAAVVRAMA